MKILIIAILIPFFCFSQLLEVKMKKSEFNVKEEIILNVKNNDAKDRFLNIQLEKYDFKRHIWKLYSKDVFSEPFTIPLELTLISEGNKSSDLMFKIKQPELFDSPKYSKKKNESIRENAKKGKFRIKVVNGYNEFEKNEISYSDSFILK
ncbi:hypothetical protein GKZ90_0022255 [Flavobacterium sp. MC2016-06]|jgi:hypothetical protein|uniref:hypothetical protein n=1 Tax=Flavobacterium sp. MC2016-06 TaxID=2676308 RepID=UPI0012BB1B12|nr:hypothetical protein [Flavobacterium sp. MC2016-06]MBU3861275.1 hypothetical protein [Flavobacterium sp. MC2016-06]